MPELAHEIARLQNAIVRDLNDIHIFVRQALPLLEDAKSTHAKSEHKKDRRYYVPSVKPSKFANRTDKELKAIFDSFASRRLYESFLITAIGEFEGFLGRVLRKVFLTYPQKLSIGVPGVAPCRSTPLETLLAASTLNELMARTIEEHLRGVFFASPKAYVDYFSKVVGTNLNDNAFLAYYEIKATRDLLVHSDRIANLIYVEKAGTLARVKSGQSIAVTSEYFDNSFATLKRISGIVKRDAAKSFPVKPKSKPVHAPA